MNATACPACGNALPLDSGYVQWCHCGWNLKPAAIGPPRTTAEALARRLSGRHAEQLRAEVLAKPPSQGHLSGASLAALLVAMLVHLVTIAVAAAGIALMITNLTNPVGFVLGPLLILLAFALRPRFGRSPKTFATRSELPALFGLVDEIGAALDAGAVHGVVISSAYNASIAQLGVRRRRYLTLGLPLLVTLDPQERVGILGHEMAHSVNGDPLRGFILGGARTALGEWYATLRTRRVVRQHSNVAAAELIAEKLMQLLSLLPWSVAVVLTQLSWRDSQRAEYYADELAASVAGNEATARALEKVRLAGTVRLAAQQAVHRRDSEGDAGDLLVDIRAKVDRIPPREHERLRRVELLPGGVADTTHPLTAYRVEFVRSLPEGTPLVTCTAERSALIDAELAPFRPHVERALTDAYRASITR